jgi:polar amino acid transport system permease protein
MEWGDAGYADELFRGLLATLGLAFASFCLGQIAALGLWAIAAFGGRLSRAFAAVYVTLLRAVPELVLVLLVFYAGTRALNDALGVAQIAPITPNATLVAIFILALVQSAYGAEVFRGAYRAIPKDEIEAAVALGMPPLTTFRRIVFPRMLPNALPGLSGLWLSCTKDTALVAVIGYGELALATRQAAGSTKEYLMFYAVAAAIYLLISTLSVIVFRWFEHQARQYGG